MTLKFSTLLASLVFVAGCQSAPYKTQYTLGSDFVSSIHSSNKQKPYALVVGDVKTLTTGMTTDMYYTRDANVVEAYTKSAWIEPPTKLIQVALMNALIASNGYKDVLMAPTEVKTPYKVDATIQKMQQSFVNGQSTVELSLMVRLVNTTAEQLVFSKIYSTTEPVKTQNADGGVLAYDQALQRLMPSIVQDLQRH